MFLFTSKKAQKQESIWDTRRFRITYIPITTFHNAYTAGGNEYTCTTPNLLQSQLLISFLFPFLTKIVFSTFELCISIDDPVWKIWSSKLSFKKFMIHFCTQSCLQVSKLDFSSKMHWAVCILIISNVCTQCVRHWLNGQAIGTHHYFKA